METEKDLEQFAEAFPRIADSMCKTAAANGQALQILKTPNDSTAVTLIMALKALYGVEVLYWEPETIWITLDREHGIDLTLEDRNKIMAAIAVIRCPSFFWDSLVFQKSVKAFCGILYDPECLLECHPAEMSWAMYEAKLLRGLDPDKLEEQPEVDEDVQQYIAVCLLRAGFVYPPRNLDMVAENLREMLPEENREFADTVKKSWVHLDKGVLPDRRFGEDAMDVQLAQLASCYLYVKERSERMAEEISRLVTY